MSAARESLLDAACASLARRPWPVVRMVDVAALAGVSRQTLYNEFGSKDGLARSLVRRETDAYLAGFERALTEGGLPAAADWTVTRAGENPLLRAVLTGYRAEGLPAPTLAAVPSTSRVPAQRRADGPLPSPAEVVALIRDRAVGALAPAAATAADRAALAWQCEVALRLALSCLLAPAGERGAAGLVRDVVGVRASSPRSS
ncbi:TetR/AcrR family transcriptional regulator [Streptomyces cavernicola]|uniref:TetR/AcrR family transcriptional regulator n=1 Tax=Streptomyces cavernicola TaxID=3043613 RepID=A0ABT6SN87_9ACTN|nr:TetR/AcrR family transcriptional regulator [Streptomyces sp. B-S-A6]MDI3408701.1 TetR/AcrR family transcriptional regulator [Streptomyces sp. B-S-A6]